MYNLSFLILALVLSIIVYLPLRCVLSADIMYIFRWVFNKITEQLSKENHTEKV